jgi:hypothetical protein
VSQSTAAQRALLERLRQVLAADERIESVWLSGSFGRGAGDAWSDIDVLAVVEEEDLPHCVAEYTGPRNPVGETVILSSLFGRIASAVTPEWERYDILFVTAKDLRGYDKDGLRPLTLASLDAPPAPPKPPKPYRPSPDALAATVREFFRILGLASVGVSREEWLSMQEGIGMLRKAVIEREDALAANQALAALFIPLARRLTAEVGGVWPQALEDATRRRLTDTLGLTLP